MNKHFTPLEAEKISGLIPQELNNPFELNTPEIAKVAAKELQDYIIENQQNWIHNFGIDTNKAGYIKGKMFGVLVVENQAKEIGYLSAFSGKLDGNTYKTLFVPSLFDTSVEDYFLDKGMTELTEIGNKIEQLKSKENSQKEIDRLKELRKNKSTTLQQKIFDQYLFLNKGKELKSLCAIFEEYSDRKPAAGAGECSAPKLLHYAFKHKMKPLAIAEFWWGTTTKSNRKHLEFYPACNDKCRPILGYMLNS
jgi:tRNA pseudouridine32 synthase/23S rRNA pseudouridine746 synthase